MKMRTKKTPRKPSLKTKMVRSSRLPWTRPSSGLSRASSAKTRRSTRVARTCLRVRCLLMHFALRGSLVPIPEERQKTGELALGRAQKDKVCPRTFTRANTPNIPQAQLVYLVVMLVETSHHPATRPCVRPRRGVSVAHTLSRTAHTRPGTTQAPG